MPWTKWKSDINQAITSVCIQIIKEPLIYFSEADIQQLLVEELRKINSISKPYLTSVHKGKNSKGKYKTSLIHREYGGGNRTRIDIVIFDPSDVQKINNVNLTIKKQYLKLAYAFELGTEKTSDTYTHLKNDLKKLIKRIKSGGTGYLIYFYKDTTQSGTGTISRVNTEEKIERMFKKVILQNPPTNKNIKILAILMRTYRHQKRMRGKCEIFNGQEWIKTNVGSYNKLQKAIINQLR